MKTIRAYAEKYSRKNLRIAKLRRRQLRTGLDLLRSESYLNPYLLLSLPSFSQAAFLKMGAFGRLCLGSFSLDALKRPFARLILDESSPECLLVLEGGGKALRKTYVRRGNKITSREVGAKPRELLGSIKPREIYLNMYSFLTTMLNLINLKAYIKQFDLSRGTI